MEVVRRSEWQVLAQPHIASLPNPMSKPLEHEGGRRALLFRSSRLFVPAVTAIPSRSCPQSRQEGGTLPVGASVVGSAGASVIPMAPMIRAGGFKHRRLSGDIPQSRQVNDRLAVG